MTKQLPQFIIAAPTSNSGKTTITLGLLRALENRGIVTQPFKVGPDYIDPKFHKVACGKNGLNLDLFMTTSEDILNTYAKYSADKELFVLKVLWVYLMVLENPKEVQLKLQNC